MPNWRLQRAGVRLRTGTVTALLMLAQNRVDVFQNDGPIAFGRLGEPLFLRCERS